MPHPETDREGIVIAVLLDGQGSAIDAGWREVEDWKPEHGALWLQLDVTSPRALAWLASQGDGLATLGVHDRRPRFEVIDDHTIRMGIRAWLPTLRRSPGADSVTNLWLQPMRAVVLSRGLLAELPEIGVRWSSGTGPKTIPGLVTEQLDAITRRLTDAVADLEQPMADLEFAAASRPEDPEDMRPLGLQIADLRRHLAPARVVVDRVLAAQPLWLIGGFQTRLSALADELRSDEAELQSLLQRSGTVNDFMSARRAARMNEILYVLTVVSTIMLPLTFITGLFGMNVGIAGGSYRGMSSTVALLVVCAALAIIAWLGYRFLVRRDLLMRAPPSKRP
jgi:zinc transporter